MREKSTTLAPLAPHPSIRPWEPEHVTGDRVPLDLRRAATDRAREGAEHFVPVLWRRGDLVGELRESLAQLRRRQLEQRVLGRRP